MESRNVEIYFISAVLLGVLVVSYYIFLPYLAAVTLAATIALAFHPLHLKIARLMKRSEGFNAFVMTVLVLVIVLAPLAYFGYQVVQEAFSLYFRIARGGGVIPQQFMGAIGEHLPAEIVREVQEAVTRYGRDLVQWTLQNIGYFFSGVAHVFANVFVGLFALYYFFKDGRRIRQALVHRLPISEQYADDILNRLHQAVNSVIYGSFAVAFAQAAFATVGFFLFGVPNAFLWGSLTVIAALIPVVGTMLTVLPAVLYLALSGSLMEAAGLAVWGTVIVGLIDNFLRPHILERGVRVHPLLILLSVFGGLPLFGPIGFVLGPITVSLLFALLDIYPHFVFGKRTTD